MTSQVQKLTADELRETVAQCRLYLRFDIRPSRMDGPTLDRLCMAVAMLMDACEEQQRQMREGKA